MYHKICVRLEEIVFKFLYIKAKSKYFRRSKNNTRTKKRIKLITILIKQMSNDLMYNVEDIEKIIILRQGCLLSPLFNLHFSY